MNVLLFAFEPFGDEALNPSLEVALRLEGSLIEGHRITVQVLPVAFAQVAGPLRDALRNVQPTLAIALGLAGGRSELSLERVAVNLVDARIPDNAGAQPLDNAVVDKGPGAYFSTLPVKAMRAALHRHGIPAQLSLSAGSFVCNQVFYLLMHELAAIGSAARGGFVHLPYLPVQAALYPGVPSMALETMIEGIRCAIACAINTPMDLAVVGGTTH